MFWSYLHEESKVVKLKGAEGRMVVAGHQGVGGDRKGEVLGKKYKVLII